MVFKKDLTPIGRKGTVVKHNGKGASTPQPRPVLDQLTGRYPKASSAPEPMPDMSPMSMPVGPFGRR